MKKMTKKKKLFRKVTALAAVVALGASLAGCGSSGEETTQRYSWPLATASPEDTVTQIFAENETVVPVTVIQAEPNKVCQVKTKATDGYEAVQLGFGAIKPKKVNKPMAGHFEKLGTEPVRYLREVRVEDASEYKTGDLQTVAAFADVKKVDVTGTSKGKGFAGVMKRYGFAGGPGGHGAHFHRAPGSVGMCATPSRVLKGMRLPGHMGCDTVTVKNLTVMRVDEEQNLILVKGAIPGGKNGIVRVRMA